MVEWIQSQLEIIGKMLSPGDVPLNERRYTCPSCKHMFNASHMSNPKTPACPHCGTTGVDPVCPLDHINCGKDPQRACYHQKVFDHAEVCPVCGEPVCPGCGSHDVEVMSRITGYLSDYSGWNAGKAQEFKDRVRYTL
jgi:hypothetical protein